MNTVYDLTIINAKRKPPNCPFPSFVHYLISTSLTKDSQELSVI